MLHRANPNVDFFPSNLPYECQTDGLIWVSIKAFNMWVNNILKDLW